MFTITDFIILIVCFWLLSYFQQIISLPLMKTFWRDAGHGSMTAS